MAAFPFIRAVTGLPLEHSAKEVATPIPVMSDTIPVFRIRVRKAFDKGIFIQNILIYQLVI